MQDDHHACEPHHEHSTSHRAESGQVPSKMGSPPSDERGHPGTLECKCEHYQSGGCASLADKVHGSVTRPLRPDFFDCGDVNEYVRSSVVGRDEAEALLVVEPFYGTVWHASLLLESYSSVQRVRHIAPRAAGRAD